MSTQNLLQRLESDHYVIATDATGIPGNWVAADPSDVAGMSNRREIETFRAAATVAVGGLVSLNGGTINEIKPADSADATASCPVGVVLRSAENDAGLAAGDRIEVVIRGYVSGASVVGGAVDGDQLTFGAVAGEFAAAAGGLPVVAVLLDSASGLVYIY